jgi:heptosyltransferase-2
LSEEKTAELILELGKVPNAQPWLLGGPGEEDRNDRLARRTGIPKVPTHLPLREFCAALANLHLLVTSDSLALHVALALRIPVAVFFGPTSAAEIELYGLGRKVLPARGFQCFYSRRCSHTPSCETFQEVAPIVDAVRSLLRSHACLGPVDTEARARARV